MAVLFVIRLSVKKITSVGDVQMHILYLMFKHCKRHVMVFNATFNNISVIL